MQEMAEDLVLMRCLRDSNMPKFVFEDVPLFGGLINDLFPGMDCPRVGYEDLKTAALVRLLLILYYTMTIRTKYILILYRLYTNRILILYRRYMFK